MKVSTFFRYLGLMSILSSTLAASILDEIEKHSPKFFAGLFDRNLYELDNVNDYDEKGVLGTALSETPQEQLERFLKRKHHRVDTHYGPRFEEYRTELKRFDPKATLGVLVQSAVQGLSAAGFIKFVLNKATEEIYSGGGLALVSALAQGAADRYFDRTVADELKKIETLYSRLMFELDHEKITAIEKKYVLERPRLPEAARKAIEDVLLADRHTADTVRHPDPINFVQTILDLPQKALIVPNDFIPKKKHADNSEEILPYGHDDAHDLFVDAREGFLDKVFPSLATVPAPAPPAANIVTGKKYKLDSSFYTKAVREQFKEIMRNICDYSYFSLSNEEDPVNKRGIIFHGKCSTGKSRAAILIAEESGLPYYELSMRGKFESDWWGLPAGIVSDGKLGSMLKALLTENAEGKKGKNVVLILNDIDRENVATVVPYLMHLFDMNHRYFPAHYLNINVDLNDVLIIATVNEDLRQNPIYNGLLSRAEFVHFPDIDSAASKEMVKQMISDRNLKVSSAFRNENWADVRQKIADFIVDHHDNHDNRDREKRAKTLLMYPETSWPAVAARNGW